MYKSVNLIHWGVSWVGEIPNIRLLCFAKGEVVLNMDYLLTSYFFKIILRSKVMCVVYSLKGCFNVFCLLCMWRFEVLF